MRIIVAPEGTEGDLRPTLALSLGLRDAGHRVEACVPPDFIDYFASRKILGHPMGMPVKQFMQMHSAMMMGKTVGTLRPMIDSFAKVVIAQFACLEAHAPGADLIVGAGLQFAGGSVAQKLGIAYRHGLHVPVVAPSPSYPPPITHLMRLPRFVNRIMWGVYQGAMNLLLKKTIVRERLRLGLPYVGDISRFFMRHMLLAMDRELAAWPEDIDEPTLSQTAYWQLPDDRELDADLLRFIDAGSAPVFIGFGSMTDPRPRQTMAIIREAVAIAGVRAIVSRGWADIHQTAMLDANIFLAGHAPHCALFPAMAAVVHHGGAGTTHSCAWSGVPQVIVPHMLDQYFWGSRVQSLGLGPAPVRRGRLTAQRLAVAIRAAIDEHMYKRNAQALGAIIRRHDGVAEAVRLLTDATR
jgi:UDP:flavonoid glycosyltransferase YjiC (YdhE family)